MLETSPQLADSVLIQYNQSGETITGGRGHALPLAPIGWLSDGMFGGLRGLSCRISPCLYLAAAAGR